MPVEQKVDRVVLEHSKGDSVEILYCGATVISWKTRGIEKLFVSSKAALDGSKPVRGGIPVVFPCFGAPTHLEHLKLPQHGFARSEIWNFDGVVADNQERVSVRLTLEPSHQIAAKYKPKFKLTYVVALEENQFSSALHVLNPDSIKELEFQALLHTYYRVSESSDVRITPLRDVHYYDKTQATDQEKAIRRIETRPEVRVLTFTDFVYENAPGNYTLTCSDDKIMIKASENFKDVVVWNPQEEGRKIGDMEDRGWERFVCVEPGYVCGFVKLSPGEEWIGQQILTVVTMRD